jgi:hypothetical protein
MKHWASETLAMSKLKQKNHQWRTHKTQLKSATNTQQASPIPLHQRAVPNCWEPSSESGSGPCRNAGKKTADRLTETTPLRRGAEDGQNVAKCIWISGSVSPGFLELSPPIVTPAAAVPQAPYRLSSLSAPCSFGRFLKDPSILELVYPGTELLLTT